MPIIQQLQILPDPQIHLSPAKRRCILCRGFGVFCHGFRHRTVLCVNGISEEIEVQRMLCKCCSRTFSLLPQFVMRRVRASLLLLLDLHKQKLSWMTLFHRLKVAWNTLHAWKKLGKALLEKLPVLLDTVTSWVELSNHLSQWQYPNFLRR